MMWLYPLPMANKVWQWVKGIKGIDLFPYNLPEVIKADEVIICEGEKDTETLKTGRAYFP